MFHLLHGQLKRKPGYQENLDLKILLTQYDVIQMNVDTLLKMSGLNS